MIAKDLRQLYDAVPFEPFRIHMASGKAVDVPHPEFMLLFKSGRKAIVERSDDTFEVIDVSLITSAETLPRNGSRRPRRRKPKR